MADTRLGETMPLVRKLAETLCGNYNKNRSKAIKKSGPTWTHTPSMDLEDGAGTAMA